MEEIYTVNVSASVLDVNASNIFYLFEYVNNYM